ncbi:MAG: chorismate mutase [Alphaproteobacteria bacterium]|nr:chorismate mutase [Alphaproteobacteria bacterium]
MEELLKLRKKIDLIDNQLIALLGERFSLVNEVVAVKTKLGLPAVIPTRVEEVRERCKEIGATYNLDKNFMHDLYTVIIDHYCEREDRFLKNK